MSDEKRYTERDLIMAMREGYHAAVLAVGSRAHMSCAGQFAKEAYPLPKVTRPRVVADPDAERHEFRIVDGRLEYRWVESNWSPSHAHAVTPARVGVWADLFANPTETVDEP